MADSLFNSPGEDVIPFLVPPPVYGIAQNDFRQPYYGRRASGRIPSTSGVDWDKLDARPGDKDYLYKQQQNFEKKIVDMRGRYLHAEDMFNSPEYRQAHGELMSNFNPGQLQAYKDLKDQHAKKLDELKTSKAGQEIDVPLFESDLTNKRLSQQSIIPLQQSMWQRNLTPEFDRESQSIYSTPIGTIEETKAGLKKLYTPGGSTSIARSGEYAASKLDEAQMGLADRGHDALIKYMSDYSNNIRQIGLKDSQGRTVNPYIKNLDENELASIGTYAWSNLSEQEKYGAKSAFIKHLNNSITKKDSLYSMSPEAYSHEFSKYLGGLAIDEAGHHVQTSSKTGKDYQDLGASGGGTDTERGQKWWRSATTRTLPEDMIDTKEEIGTRTIVPTDPNNPNAQYGQYTKGGQKINVEYVRDNEFSKNYFNSLAETAEHPGAKVDGTVITPGGTYLPASALTQGLPDKDGSGTIVAYQNQMKYGPAVVKWDVQRKQPVLDPTQKSLYALFKVRVTDKDLKKNAFTGSDLTGMNPTNPEQDAPLLPVASFADMNPSRYFDNNIRFKEVRGWGFGKQTVYEMDVWMDVSKTMGFDNSGLKMQSGSANGVTYKPF